MEKVTAKRIRNDKLNIEKYFSKEQNDVNKKRGTNVTKRKNISFQESKSADLLKKNIKKVKKEEVSKRERKHCSFSGSAATLVTKEPTRKDNANEKNSKNVEIETPPDIKGTQLLKGRVRRGKGTTEPDVIEEYIRTRKKKEKNEMPVEEHNKATAFTNIGVFKEEDRRNLLMRTVNEQHTTINIDGVGENADVNAYCDEKYKNNDNDNGNSSEINDINSSQITNGEIFARTKNYKKCNLVDYQSNADELKRKRSLRTTESGNLFSSHSNVQPDVHSLAQFQSQSHSHSQWQLHLQSQLHLKGDVKQEDNTKMNTHQNEKMCHTSSTLYNPHLGTNGDIATLEERNNTILNHSGKNNSGDKNNENILKTSNLDNSQIFFKFGVCNREENNIQHKKMLKSNLLESRKSRNINLEGSYTDGINRNDINRNDINKKEINGNLNKSTYMENEKMKNEIIQNEKMQNEKMQNEKILNEKILNEKMINEKMLNEKMQNEKMINEKMINEKSKEGTIYSYADRMKDHLDAMGMKIKSRSKERSENSTSPLKKSKTAAELFYSTSEGILKNTSHYGSILSDEFLSKILRDYYSNNSSNMLDTLNDLHSFMSMASNTNVYSYDTLNGSSSNSGTYYSKNKMYDLGSFFPCFIENGEEESTGKNLMNSTTSRFTERDSKEQTENAKSEQEEELLGKEEKEVRELYLNHSDLLINKREKRSIHEEGNKDNHTENFRSKFWSINRKKFFEKYTKSSLTLTRQEVEKFKELIPLSKREGDEDEEVTDEDEEDQEEIETDVEDERRKHKYSYNDNYTINDLFSCVCMNVNDDLYSQSDIYMNNKENEETEVVTNRHITDVKLDGFQLDLINGFLYDKQSAYEKEILKNHKLFAHISSDYKNTNVNVEKILHLFPRDFIKKYKVTKKLGQGVYGKVFNAESLDDSYLNFAIKSLRYFWPNFKFKFGLEEFACNELNIMRHIMHPNVVCLLDHFRVRTFRKDRYANNRNHRYKNATMNNGESEEYDFSTLKTDRTEHIRFFPSDETYRKNEKYNAIISKNKMTIEQLESQLIMDSVNWEHEEQCNNQSKCTTLKNARSRRGKENGYLKSRCFDERIDGDGLLKNEQRYEIDENDNGTATTDETRNDISTTNTHNPNRISNMSKNNAYFYRENELHNGKGSQEETMLSQYKAKNEKKKMIHIQDKLIDKLQYRKFSRNYKKIENLNYDYVENWNLFLVMEKCDYALSEILEKMRNKYFRFLQGIKQEVSKLFVDRKVEICYEHLYNYVKYVYLPLKKESGKFFYPDFPALTETQTKVVIYQMLQGINQIHKEFVIHRDIKPANTLIKNIQYLADGLNDSKEWIIKIGDFGLSIHDKFFQPEKKDSNIITLQYRPPEIMCNNDIYNYSVDIWSVGMTMCECLLGFVPVASKFDSSVLYKILVFRGIPKQYFSELLKEQFVGELPNFDTDRLKMLHLVFTDIYGRKLLSDDGIDLIDKFLSYDYKTRITANEALKHTWFKDVAIHLNEDLLRFYKESGTYYF